jgi:hypothetical protein
MKRVVVDVVKRSLAIVDAQQAMELAKAKQQEAIAICTLQIEEAMKSIAINLAYLDTIHIPNLSEITQEARLKALQHILDAGVAPHISVASVIEDAMTDIDGKYSIESTGHDE